MNEHWTGGIIIYKVMILCLCPLFNDAASCLDYVTGDG
jgi:hypothetical protein